MDFPGTAQSVAAAVAGGIGLLFWFVKTQPKRKEKALRRKIRKIEDAMGLARYRHDETEYNRLSAERKRLLDSWVS